MSRQIRKLTTCIGENKDTVTAQLISAFVFATQIVQFLFGLDLKCQVSRCFLRLYRALGAVVTNDKCITMNLKGIFFVPGLLM